MDKRVREENYEDKIIDLRRKRQEKKKKSKWKAIVFLVVITIIAVMLSPYFKIKWFDVQGNVVVADRTIKSATGVALGENLFSINIKKVKNNVRKIPFIKDAKIFRNLSGGIVIKVEEREKFGYIKMATGDLVIDKTGRVLDIAGKEYDYTNLVEIAGLKPGKLKPGDFINQNYSQNIAVAVEIWDKIVKNEMDERVTSLNVKNYNNVTMLIDGDKNVIVGDTYRIDYKLAMLESAIASLAPSDKGTLDISKEGEALFSPTE
jgi:cell division protein FtsQ